MQCMGRLLAHGCPGRVRRHVRSWRKLTWLGGRSGRLIIRAAVSPRRESPRHQSGTPTTKPRYKLSL
jgi:hypothetical protein